MATKTDGLGGARNLRGILRNRVVGDGVAWGNAEFRWRVVNFIIARQNFYFGMSFFGDAGLVVQEINFNRDYIDQAELPDYFDFSYTHDGIHPSAGAGLKLGWNENFILTLDFGFALNRQDGTSGLYIGFGNLF